MRILSSTNVISTFLALLFFISLTADAAFYDSRSEKWEFYLAPQFTNSKNLQFENGSEAFINERSSIGFGFGYNLNHHIELSGAFSSGNSNVTGTVILDDGSNTPQNFTSTFYTSSLNFGFTYNIFSTPFTPYVTANLGTTFIDSNIVVEGAPPYCWWGYWGYTCSVQTHTTTELNYGAALGLRWDFNRKVYIKGEAGKNYLDLGSSNTPDFTTYRFIVGLMF